ncbi:MAG: NEW3 domain-containing protein, partial [Nonlabens sp.]|nr:NEW3 domain-containing protein [Nonlabens sp.]
KKTDPVRGEVREPLYVVPALSLGIANPVYVFNDNAQQIEITVKPFSNLSNTTVALQHPKNWMVSPATINLNNLKKGISQKVNFTVTAPKTAASGTIAVTATSNDRTYSQDVITLDYNHIPDQQYVVDATATVVKPALINNAKRVAYITGAGDDVPLAIAAMGSSVEQFTPSNLPSDLGVYDAVMIGIRAANVHDDLPNLKPVFSSYVNAGGTLIMQYNTAGRFDKNALGPLDITLSRKRVTDENAAITFLAPDHRILNTPNKITQADFKDWVQERGLYFPEKWDAAFEPILGMKDGDEEMTTGSLIVAPYGKGHVIYTGLSLFRELPAGVPGAYRLLANMLNMSK